ncbi:L-serine ammonia-lyase [Vibrio sp. CAIM 722]|uniref:L-serine dehydratase n=1 Tax=Vibrio eleionomae TaxID=2653505 RepID=A0A7X4RU93_9VIBR|nr:L-serine ammonia-lyase [Vibrio eleionomae]MZI92844.1 L-serine ammonia-lyase [Vibrio eleionomae]
MLSMFDIFKIGVGPSSSHTNGPMLAAARFSQQLPTNMNVHQITVDLYGSLSLTGKGHHTDRAIIVGLHGQQPDTMDGDLAKNQWQHVIQHHRLTLPNQHTIAFNPQQDIIFHPTRLSHHENGLTITASDAKNQPIAKQTYYSIGGGFIDSEQELLSPTPMLSNPVPYPFTSAHELLKLAELNGLSLSGLVLRNELTLRDMAEIDQKVDLIWQVMQQCMEKGFNQEGVLEGGLSVTRRAPALLKKLEANITIENDPMAILDWVNLFAFAVSEENAAGGQVVTSPTNGAAGVIPAVLMYFNKFVHQLDTKQMRDFLAVAGAIGMLYKTNASISGAEVGCQGEIGVSSSMAAAGLTSLWGGSNEQICMAAEIAMEHSLGMTCDPIGGLVQVPCIERNAMGAMKAINASRMALKRTSKCLISLDKVIDTMYQTGKDMHEKYRETSLGGLALIHLAPPCE